MAEKLALDGGDRVVPEGHGQGMASDDSARQGAVLVVFDSGHLHGSSAPRCLELQERWANTAARSTASDEQRHGGLPHDRSNGWSRAMR